MRMVCAVDGTPFEAKRATAKYCSERCKKQAQRRPKSGGTAGDGNVVAFPGVKAKEGLVSATRAELERFDRLNTALGRAALFIAERIEQVGLVDTGAGVAALVKEHRAALAEALKDATGDEDVVDDIRRSAALKLIGAAG